MPEPVAAAVVKPPRPQPPANKTVRSAAAPKTVRPSNATNGAAAPVIASATTEVAPVAPPLPPSPPPVIETPSVVPQPPVGRLFESSDVDEAPRIATRVEPQLSADFAQGASDVVVVRILVSHTGHPFRVNLLRRSRYGANVDEAVLAAVRRWTFSPARRHGEAVSCYYNFGVALKSE
jgi:protein TonB